MGLESARSRGAAASLSISVTLLHLPLSLPGLHLLTFLLCPGFVSLPQHNPPSPPFRNTTPPSPPSPFQLTFKKKSATLLSLDRGNAALHRSGEMSRGNRVSSGGQSRGRLFGNAKSNLGKESPGAFVYTGASGSRACRSAGPYSETSFVWKLRTGLGPSYVTPRFRKPSES